MKRAFWYETLKDSLKILILPVQVIEIKNNYFQDIENKIETLTFKINANKQRLNKFIFENINANHKIFELYRVLKGFEAVVLSFDINQLDSEQQFLVAKLRYYYSILEKKSQKYNVNELEMILNQKERLMLTLQKLLIDLDEKIWSFRNLAHYKLNENKTPTRKMDYSFTHNCERDSFYNMDTYQINKRKICEHKKAKYYLIVPSPIELK